MLGWADMVTLSYACHCGYERTKEFIGLEPDEVVSIRHICSPDSGNQQREG